MFGQGPSGFKPRWNVSWDHCMRGARGRIGVRRHGFLGEGVRAITSPRLREIELKAVSGERRGQVRKKFSGSR
jgi:hypothetical protein